MIRVTTYDIENLARLIGALPPPPEGWVAAAQELPRARAGLDELIVRAEGDARLRSRLVLLGPSLLLHSGLENLISRAKDFLCALFGDRGCAIALQPLLNVSPAELSAFEVESFAAKHRYGFGLYFAFGGS